MADCADGSCVPRHLSREAKRKEFEHDPAHPEVTWKGLRESMLGLGDQFFSHDVDATQLEEGLHDLWDEVIHAARILPADSPEVDRLVMLILEARELGLFVRKDNDNNAPQEREVARLPNGQSLWTDLPYLVQEVRDAWTKESNAYTSAERESLAVLTAKLCAVGVCPTELGDCALWLFREAFETERPLTMITTASGTTSLSGASLPADKGPIPSVVDLLPACLSWLRYANVKLAKLSVTASSRTIDIEDASVLSAPGSLARQADITQGGFSVARWLFWRRRFKELYARGDSQVAKLARACFEESILTGLSVGLEIPGERMYQERLFEALDRELVARGFTQCVGPEDIEIDMEWAQ